VVSAARIAWLNTFAANGLLLACNVATGILVARLLLPDGRGALAAIIFWPSLIWSLAMLSLEQAVAYQVARTDPRRLRANGDAISLALGLATAIVTVVLVPYLLGPERRDLWWVTQIYALTLIPIISLGAMLRGIDYGELKIGRYNLWRLLGAGVHVVGLLVIWLLDVVSVAAALWAFWSSLVAMAVGPLLVRRFSARMRPSWPEAAALLRIMGRFQGTNLVFLLNTHADRAVIILLYDNVAIGLYVVALTWASTGLSPVWGAFQSIAFPYLSGESDPDRQRRFLARGIRYACCLLTAAAAVLTAVTYWLLPFFFGAGFRAAVPVAIALLVAHVPLALRQIVVHSLRGLGETRSGTVAELLTLMTFAAVAWPGAALLGLTGFGVALAIANAVGLGYLVHVLRRQFAIRPADCWGLDAATVRELIGLALEAGPVARVVRQAIAARSKLRSRGNDRR
jgi:enterobacterial common antigen flippase